MLFYYKLQVAEHVRVAMAFELRDAHPAKEWHSAKCKHKPLVGQE